MGRTSFDDVFDVLDRLKRKEALHVAKGGPKWQPVPSRASRCVHLRRGFGNRTTNTIGPDSTDDLYFPLAPSVFSQCCEKSLTKTFKLIKLHPTTTHYGAQSYKRLLFANMCELSQCKSNVSISTNKCSAYYGANSKCGCHTKRPQNVESMPREPVALSPCYEMPFIPPMGRWSSLFAKSRGFKVFLADFQVLPTRKGTRQVFVKKVGCYTTLPGALLIFFFEEGCRNLQRDPSVDCCLLDLLDCFLLDFSWFDWQSQNKIHSTHP